VLLASLAPARRRVVLATLGLAVVVILVVAGVLTARALDEVEPVSQDDRGPVLLVSGYGGNLDALAPLASAVEESGRDVVVVPVVGDGTGDLDEQAAALGERVGGLLADGAPSVDVVGYSAGGVVARAWVADHGGDEQARRLVTLGSPHHGTETAQLALDAAGTCPEACVQLAPDSDLLRALNAGDETPAGPEWVSVWTDTDRVVVPADSARLAGATNVPVQEVCPRSAPSHGDLPGDPAAVALVLAALSSPDAERLEVDVSC
jgi:triacylglycerol lipase